MKTILVACDFPFWFDDDGARKRLNRLYRYLNSRKFNVPVFYTEKLGDKDKEVIRNKYKGMEIYTLPDIKNIIGFKYYAKKVLPRKVLDFFKYLLYIKDLSINMQGKLKERVLDDFSSYKIQRYFQDICITLKPDFILIEYIRNAYLIKNIKQSLRKEAITIIDTHDVMHQRAQRFHQNGQVHWINISEKEEKKYTIMFESSN